MKKTAILLIALLCGYMQAQAYELEVDGIYYNFKDNTSDEVVVTCFIDYWHDDFDGEGNYKGDIVIPETIIYENKIYRVTGIDYYGFEEGEIESVVVPKSVKSIGNSAFRNLRGTLKQIEVQWQTLLELQELEIENNELCTDYEDIVLVVPTNTKRFYLEHEVWQNFINIEEKDWDAGAGTVEFQGAKYENCRASFFDADKEHIFISLTQNNNASDNYALSDFDLYFLLKKDNAHLPVGNFIYNPNLPVNDDNPIKDAGFVRNFNDWYTAQHSYKCKQFNIDIQILENGYSLEGEMILDNQANDTIKLNYSGAINNESPEVQFISGYSSGDFKSSSGFFTIDGQKISTPYAFSKWEEDVKIYLLNKDLCHDRALEYGISFKLYLQNSIEGTFIYNKDASVEDETKHCFPVFFNQTGEEYPNEATISISKTKQHEVFQINYTLKFSDNRVVNGSYTGKIPERKR